MVKLPQIGTNGELTGDGVIYPEYTPFKPPTLDPKPYTLNLQS